MKKYIILLVSVIFTISCGEKLIEEPENLIPRKDMVLILKDMAIVNAAKGINMGILKDNGIDPTSYILNKYEIDSAQFVDSDRYYASLPLQYEGIYKEVEGLLDEEKIRLEELKKINDSLKLQKRKEVDLLKKDGVEIPAKTKNIPQ